METNDLKEFVIDELANSPVGKKLKQVMDTVYALQKGLFKSEDGGKLQLLKIGTVVQLLFIDVLASGKTSKDLSKEDWKNIAEKVSKYAILEEGQSYSEFVFTLYADYINLSVKGLHARGVSKENAASVKEIADEIRKLTKQFHSEKITEVDYVDQCLWLSLEAMIKCLSMSLTVLIGPEFSQFTQAVSQLAFEYGRYVMYSREQAILEEYLNNQRVLDENLQKEYAAYLDEVNKIAEKFQSLVDDAFSVDIREALEESVALAKAAGVKEDELLKTTEEIDDFFM